MVMGYGVFGHVSGDDDASDDAHDGVGAVRAKSRRWNRRSRQYDDDAVDVVDDCDDIDVQDVNEDDLDSASWGDEPVSGWGYAPVEQDPWSDALQSGKMSGRSALSGNHVTAGDVIPFAALRTDVTTSVSRAVLDRARGIMRQADTMFVKPQYEADSHTGYADLSALVRGTTSPSSRYRTAVQIDMETGEVSGGTCTCPAYGRGYGMCKHMAALALEFCDEPQRFEGYGAGAVRPSRSLLAYMERVDKQESQRKSARRRAVMSRIGDQNAGRDQRKLRSGRRRGGRPDDRDGYNGPNDTVGTGQVWLKPTLSFLDGVWSVEFRIGSDAVGADYVLKSIPRFIDVMAHNEYEEYGRKLAFTHVPDMLDSGSRPLLGFLQSAIGIRRAAEQQDRYYGHIAIDRRLTLSASEVARLLSLRVGFGVQLVLDSWFAGQPAFVPVDEGEPELSLHLRRRDLTMHGADIGYMLHGEPPISTVVEGERETWLLLASDNPTQYMSAMMAGSQRISAAGCRFVRCPKRLQPLHGLLEELFRTGGRDQVIGAEDIALFARTLLPRLVEAGLLEAGEIPRELAELSPAECVPSFYLDRDEHGVQCEVKARYGNALVPLLPGGAAMSVQGTAETAHDFGGTAVIGRDFDTEHLALDVVREYFTLPGEQISADTHSPRNAAQARGRRQRVGGGIRGVAGNGAAIIDKDDTHRIVRLFDEGLSSLREMGEVFTTPAFDRLVAPKAPTVKVGLSVRGNLVEISPIADEVPPDEVGSLLASYRRRQRYHQLKDGTLVALSGAQLNTLDALARDLDLSEDDLNAGVIELPGGQAFLLDGELPDDGSDVVKDASFVDYIDDMKVIDPTSYVVPESLQPILRPYQQEGFRWLSTLCDKGFGGILADEMGLGKSVQLIALLLARYEHMRGSDAVPPSLIVCPASLVYNWAAEFAKFAPALNAVVVSGSKSERRMAIGRAFQTSEPTVLITSYDLLRRDVDEYVRQTAGTTGDQATELPGFLIMALDEAQYIKNHTTKIAKAVKSVPSKHRFALTGTPIENRLSELWSIFDFLMPGLLGSYKRFHERYELPIANGRAADSSTPEGNAAAQVNPESARVAHKLQSLVGVFIKRRLKSQVLTDLPDKLETILTVRLEGEQRKLYAAHEQRLRMQLEHSDQSDFNTSKIRILAELTKLRQICCDPRLLYANAKDQSAKLAAIAELVETCADEGKKALVFSQFTSFLALIAERLDSMGLSYYTITGSTAKKRRLELVDQFNDDATPAFLISLKAGNTGLNLTGASVVIHADPWWNAAAQNQATDRAHRIGQTQNVNVYQVVAKDTIEERILELQHTKSELARQFTDASLLVGGRDGETDDTLAGQTPVSIATLTRDDLLGLLG
ncbi:DEAD/DEAH box helicase [Bifidobacterium olomucense]|uniref:Helicase n=1 Tax=Bifidobacterium olomucense TaxID=2675324 RepID=A0A7Y0HW71_9BIFI|nr:DEAD/DEAH box helicase [Bifidobacterium sp. DSM 109959]NMM97353.1 helicase [Bifidobacterium sp. DSM 109959]